MVYFQFLSDDGTNAGDSNYDGTVNSFNQCDNQCSDFGGSRQGNVDRSWEAPAIEQAATTKQGKPVKSSGSELF